MQAFPTEEIALMHSNPLTSEPVCHIWPLTSMPCDRAALFCCPARHRKIQNRQCDFPAIFVRRTPARPIFPKSTKTPFLTLVGARTTKLARAHWFQPGLLGP